MQPWGGAKNPAVTSSAGPAQNYAMNIEMAGFGYMSEQKMALILK